MRYQRVHNCCSKRPVKRGLWSPDEDLNLIRYIRSHGAGSWPSLPDRAGLERCGKSCRLRWMNYLRPGIKRGKFSQEEENAIICLHTVMENRWAQIAKHLPGRTDSEIKNYWHSRLKKKKATIASVALNPFTHGATDSNTVVDLQYHSPSVHDSIASLQHFTIIDSELQSCVESLQMNELAQGSNNNSNFLESAFGQGQDFPLSGQRSLFSNVFSEDLRSISDVMVYMQSNHES